MKTASPVKKLIFPPHLKSGRAFEWLFVRESAGTLILFFAAIFFGGAAFAFSVAKVLLIVIAGDELLRAAGYATSPKWDNLLFNQAFFLCFFLPEHLALSRLIPVAIILVLFYRVSGGRAGYVIQPVCIALAVLQCLGISPVFCFHLAPMWAAGVILALWFAARFPRSLIESQRLIAIIVMSVLVSLLKGAPLPQALLWGAVAGEIVFDSTLAPLTKQGRLWYQGIVLMAFAVVLAFTKLSEAMIFVGLAAGFFAGWIEEWTLKGKIYESTKTR